MSSVRAWLERHGLEEHADAFEAEAIELNQLSSLSADDLRELRMPIGHRKRFEAAVRASLDTATSSESGH